MLLVLFLWSALNVSAAPSTAPTSRQAAGPRFLTLPFTDPGVVVQQGWIYDWGTEHQGLDYILGERNGINWRPFDVVAAADGYACGNCTSRQGNAIWIKHVVDGQTYYTYYGHLDTIDPAIPIGNQQNTVFVRRGQKLGVSGTTGSDVLHLHFQVSAPNAPVDPYDLWTTKGPYFPGCASCRLGPANLWTTNPPSLPSGEQPASTPAPPPPPPSQPTPSRVPPTATRVPPTNTPIPTPTKVTCNLPYEQTVEGRITDKVVEVKYCLTVAANDWVSIRMFAIPGSRLDTYIRLVGPDGKVAAVDDDGAQMGGNSFLVKQLTAAGAYELVATRFGETTGQYRLRVEKGSKSALGDLNRDCVVNLADIEIMSSALGGHDPNADLNLDGGVDGEDHKAMIYRLGRGCMQIK